MVIAVKPWERNFTEDLDFSSLLVSHERCLLQAPLSAAVRSWAGTSRVGMLITLVDTCASTPALACGSPDWTATQDLAIHATGWLTEGPIIVDSSLVRLGKKAVTIAADIYDGHGIDDFGKLQARIDAGCGAAGDPTLAAKSLVTFVRIPRTGASGVDQYNPVEWVGQIRKKILDGPAQGTLNERIGLQVLDAASGIIEMACVPYVGNSIGTINGGVQSMLIEAAAEAMRPGLVATDMQIHFLAQLKAGPARTVGVVSRDAPDHSVVTVRLLDAGAGDRLLTLATVTLQQPPN